VTAPIRISVVIPTYQRRASVRRALEALARQTVPGADFEVIVSIDGSNDGTTEMVESFEAPFSLRCVWRPNAGRAAARNAGLALATGDLIVLLDDDMEPTPGCLAGHLRAHPPGPRRGVVGAAPMVCDDGAPPLVQYLSGAFRARLDALAQREGPLRFNDAYSGNFSVRREVVRSVGGFDETFAVYGHEDYEWARRLAAAGVELAYAPDAEARQHFEKSVAQVARDGMDRGRTAVLFAAKHPEVVGTLKLGSYGDATPRWRAIRAALLALGSRRMPALVLTLLERVEQRRPARLSSYYAKAFDYFYWVGVRSAQRTTRLRFGRVTAGVLLIVVYAALSNARWVYTAWRAAVAGQVDDISAYERRFDVLRGHLPARGVVGYFDGLDSASFTSSEFKRFVLTQYAIAPTLLVRDSFPELVIANFRPGIDSVRIPPPFELVHDFGDGLLLLRRPTP
jgi:GT2 family glycosyltransferase